MLNKIWVLALMLGLGFSAVSSAEHDPGEAPEAAPRTKAEVQGEGLREEILKMTEKEQLVELVKHARNDESPIYDWARSQILQNGKRHEPALALIDKEASRGDKSLHDAIQKLKPQLLKSEQMTGGFVERPSEGPAIESLVTPPPRSALNQAGTHGGFGFSNEEARTRDYQRQAIFKETGRLPEDDIDHFESWERVEKERRRINTPERGIPAELSEWTKLNRILEQVGGAEKAEVVHGNGETNFDRDPGAPRTLFTANYYDKDGNKREVRIVEKKSTTPYNPPPMPK